MKNFVMYLKSVVAITFNAEYADIVKEPQENSLVWDVKNPSMDFVYIDAHEVAALIQKPSTDQ